MTLIDDIKRDLTDESVSLTNTLRKAKILATTMRLAEFREWVDFELSGYPDNKDVPDYRVLHLQSVGQFSGSFGSGASNVPLPLSNLPQSIRNFAETLRLSEGIGEIEALRRDDIAYRWPPEQVMLARPYLKMENGMVLVDAHRPIPASATSGILDQVKNKLLDFLLSLEENHIVIESLSDSQAAMSQARNLFNVNIYGDRNIVASGEKVHQQSINVREGNLDSLLELVRSLGVSDEAVRELQDALALDGPPKDGRLGMRVKAWLGGIAESAAVETLKVGSHVAIAQITSAILTYYGLAA